MGYYLLLKICFSRLLWIINSSLENIFYDRIKVVFWTVCSTWVTAPLHCQRGFVQISKKYWKYKWWWKTSKLYISETKKNPTVINVIRFTHFQKEKQNVLDQFQYLGWRVCCGVPIMVLHCFLTMKTIVHRSNINLFIY